MLKETYSGKHCGVLRALQRARTTHQHHQTLRSCDKRYSEFQHFYDRHRKQTQSFVNSFPPKVQNPLESAHRNNRVRRYELNMWLSEVAAMVDMSLTMKVGQGGGGEGGGAKLEGRQSR